LGRKKMKRKRREKENKMIKGDEKERPGKKKMSK